MKPLLSMDVPRPIYNDPRRFSSSIRPEFRTPRPPLSERIYLVALYTVGNIVLLPLTIWFWPFVLYWVFSSPCSSNRPYQP